VIWNFLRDLCSLAGLRDLFYLAGLCDLRDLFYLAGLCDLSLSSCDM
jgi:hypothetical protein